MCNFCFVRTFGCFATAAEWIMILDAGHMLLCINWSMLLGTCCLFLQIFFWLPYWLVHLLLHCLVIWILMPSVQHCHHWILLKIHTKFLFSLWFVPWLIPMPRPLWWCSSMMSTLRPHPITPAQLLMLFSRRKCMRAMWFQVQVTQLSNVSLIHFSFVNCIEIF